MRPTPVFPFPEAIEGRGDGWTIHDDPADGGAVDIENRSMVVTLDATRIAANVRAHELGHIKWSPEQPTPCGDSDIDTIRAIEDGRINLMLSRSGVDLSGGLHDARKFNQGFASAIVLGQLREAVLGACAVFGTGHERDVHRTLYRLKREKLPQIAVAATMIEQVVAQMREAYNDADLTTYEGTQALCAKLEDMLRAPPQPQQGEGEGEGEPGGDPQDGDDSSDASGGEGDGNDGTDGDGEKDKDKPATSGDSEKGGGKDSKDDEQDHQPADEKDDDDKSDSNNGDKGDRDDTQQDGDKSDGGDDADQGGDDKGEGQGGDADGNDSQKGDAENDSAGQPGASGSPRPSPEPPKSRAQRLEEQRQAIEQQQTVEEAEAQAKRETRARRAQERAKQAREAAQRAAQFHAQERANNHVVERAIEASKEWDERRIVYGSPRVMDELVDDGVAGLEQLMGRYCGQGVGEWAPMRVVKCHLPKRVTRTESPRKRWAPEGYHFRAPHRLFSDGNAFIQHSGGRGGGSVLIDCSGSMGLTMAQVKAIVKNAPAVQVAMYWGDASRTGTVGRGYGSPEQRKTVGAPIDQRAGEGYLRVIAKGGRTAEDEDLFTTGPNNCVDGTALKEWLAKQPHPRIWVSDGKVNGSDGGMTRGLLAEARRLCLTKGIIRVGSVANALELFEQIRKRQARLNVR